MTESYPPEHSLEHSLEHLPEYPFKYVTAVVRAYVFGWAALTESLPFLPLPTIPKHPMADCDGCPLYGGGTYVPSTFPARPCRSGQETVAFVGEAPGENEIKQGKVFIGLSGKVLDGVLDIVRPSVNINRAASLMTNACSCHYPKEEFDNLPRKAVEHCRPRLIHELELAGVDVAVTLGAHAMRSLLNTKEGITLARAGGPRPSDYVDGLLVVPTFHPAYAMRDHTKFPFILDDISKVRDGVWDKWPGVKFRVVRTAAEAAKEILAFWRGTTEPLEVDSESGADKDETFGGAIKDVLCLGIWDELAGEAVVFPRDVFTDENRRMMGKLFMRNGISGQNLKYDICRVLNVFLGVDQVLDIRLCGDRMLQSYCLNETPGIHGLDYMGREHLGMPRWKHVIKDSMEEGRRKAKAEAKARGEKIGTRFNGLNYGFIDPEVLYEYNAYDVAGTRMLKDVFDPELDGVPGLRDLYDFLLQVSRMLIHTEQNGMMVDLDYNAQLERELREDIGAIDFGSGVGKFNPNSPPQVKSLLRELGIEVDDTRKDTLKSLVARYELTGERDDIVDFCNTLLTFRGDSKMLSTYVIGLRNSLIDGIAHPDFGVLSTSGRLKARNPNSQNTPKGSKYRRQYVARPGRIFVTADYGQAELRVMCWLALDEALREMFMTPGDLFTDMCRNVYAAYDGFADEKRDKCRQLIKTIAYGTTYNRRPNAIASAFGIPVMEAKKIQRDFNAKIPGVIKYRNGIMEQAVGCGDLVTVFGRRRRFRLVTDLNKVDIQNEAAAFMPQSTANDICLTSAIQLDNDGLDLVSLVHDEIIAEVDKADEEEAKQHMRKTMLATAERITENYVPWKVGIESGRSYGDFK